jgi:hypothetical protein
MAIHVFVFLLVVCLLLSLERLGRLDWIHVLPSSSRRGAKRTKLHRSLCPAAQTIAPSVGSAPLPRRVESQLLCSHQASSRPPIGSPHAAHGTFG